MAIGDQAPSKTIGTRKSDVAYVNRHAVRVIAFNGAGEVAIIHAERDNYFKLPGGGIDPDEDHEVAVQREMQEETGYVIKLRDSGCIATTEEIATISIRCRIATALTSSMVLGSLR